MIKKIKTLALSVLIFFLFFITNGFTKALPPGSGEGDMPANVLILLDKSGSMGWRTYTGPDTRYPDKLAVGSTEVSSGRNIMVAPRWSWLASKIVSYNNKETYSWKKTSSPCRYSSTTKGIEFYNNDFYFLNTSRELCKVNQVTGATTRVKQYNSNVGMVFGTELHDKYLYTFTTKKIIIRDLSNNSEKECSYGNSNKKLGWFLGRSSVYNNGSPEINKAGTYLILFHYENSSKQGFYKFNLTAGLNCPDETQDGYIKYSSSWSGSIKGFESSSLNNNHFYIANYSKHKVTRLDLSDNTLSSSDIKDLGKYARHSSSYSPTKRSEVRFSLPMEIAVDSTNNRVYVSGYGNNTVQVFDEESDGLDWVKKLGATGGSTRMKGAQNAIQSITTDANLTSGVHFGFAYWSSSGGIWVYTSGATQYPSCISIKKTLLAKYSWLSSSHWIFNASRKYRCRDMGSNYGYTGWNSTKDEAIPCDRQACLKVKIDKFGAAKTAKFVPTVSPGGGTDAKQFTKIALDYFKHKDSPIDKSLTCQVNYIIVVGDGDWSNHTAAMKDITALKDVYGVKTITIAYGTGINAGGLKRFKEAAEKGGTKDVIVAKDAQSLKAALSAEINRITAEKVSFTAPAITASIKEGGALLQAQFKYVQNQEWRGTLKKTKLNDDGSVVEDSKGNPKVEWEADKEMPIPSQRKIWTVLKGGAKTDYKTNNYNNFVTSNRDEIYEAFTRFGVGIQDYHSQTTAVNTSRCKSVSTVEDGIDDDTEGLISFYRGQDYFDYDGDCNLTEKRVDSDGNHSYLGDIYHSEMIVVGKPNAETSFTSEREEAYWRSLNKYDAWATDLENREEIIYVGANDGMLHAINHKTGKEKWAFIPPFILGQMPLTMNKSLNTDKPSPSGGSNAIYGVDGSPVQHDMFFDNPHDVIGENWYTVLMVPYGRGGNGYSVLDVTDPEKPLHLFSIFNDKVNNKVYVMDYEGKVDDFEYMAKSYSLSQTSEAQKVTENYQDDNSVSGSCDTTQNTSCYQSKSYKIENFPVNGLTASDITVEINGNPDKNFIVSNTSNVLNITFGASVRYQANDKISPPSDNVGIFINPKSAAAGVQSPNTHYDYSQLGETWSAPRIIRIPNTGPGDKDVTDDIYVAVMGAGYGARYSGVGSGVFIINLQDTKLPGKLEKFVYIDDKEAIVSEDIVNSVPGDPLIINADNAKGFVNFKGALVYINDLEGKITKINLTNLEETLLTLYDHYTMFDIQTTASQGRLMFHSMDAAIGKETKNLWLFAGTGDYENLTEKSTHKNVLLGISDETFPRFGKPVGSLSNPATVNDLTKCSDTTKDTTGVKCPHKLPAGTPKKVGWYIELGDSKKVTASPTVSGGIVYYPIFEPPPDSDKCGKGTATICAVDDECGTNLSSLLGKHPKDDECHFVGIGILSRIVVFGGKLFANIAGETENKKDLIVKDTIGVEVDITRGTWKENF
mgnify:CR=1 FL=1